jgi:hypothetical protein
MRYVSAILIFVSGLSTAVFGQDATIKDLNALVGKQVIVQRMPLCQPGTYQQVLTYAGKQATVVSLKPFKLPFMAKVNMSRLTPEVRATIEDAQHMSTMLVKFEDGTQLDSCSPVLPSMFSNYFELVPGQTIESSNISVVPAAVPTAPVVATAVPVATAKPVVPINSQQECPVVVTKATSTDGGFRHLLIDTLTKSEFERAVEKATQGGRDPHYLDVRMRNNSEKGIRGIEAFVVYLNIMGDQSATSSILSQNDKPIKPSGEYKGYSVDTYESSSNGKGDVSVYVNRVRFEDNSFWYDNGSHSCALLTQIKQ